MCLGRTTAVTLAVLVGCCEGLQLGLRTSCRRRSVLLGAPLALWRPGEAAAADSYESLATRMRQPVVPEVGEKPASGPEPPLPAWMVGRWRCEQTLTIELPAAQLLAFASPVNPVVVDQVVVDQA